MPKHIGGEGGDGIARLKCPDCRKVYEFGIREPTKEQVERWIETFRCKCGYNDKSDFHKMIKEVLKNSKKNNQSPYKEKVKSMLEKGIRKQNIAAELHIRPETVSRIVKKLDRSIDKK